jgi:hypothetical protein
MASSAARASKEKRVSRVVAPILFTAGPFVNAEVKLQ